MVGLLWHHLTKTYMDFDVDSYQTTVNSYRCNYAVEYTASSNWTQWNVWSEMTLEHLYCSRHYLSKSLSLQLSKLKIHSTESNCILHWTSSLRSIKNLELYLESVSSKCLLYIKELNDFDFGLILFLLRMFNQHSGRKACLSRHDPWHISRDQ